MYKCIQELEGADYIHLPGEGSCSKMQQGLIPNPKDVAEMFVCLYVGHVYIMTH